MKTMIKTNEQKPIQIKGVGKGQRWAKTPITKKDNAKLPVSSEISEALIMKVYQARKDGMSFNQLEEKFGLKRANGMTSFRLVAKAKKMVKAGKAKK